ncbi:MAG: hypothetical protein ACM3MH_04705 [Actinomycetota bacterium]
MGVNVLSTRKALVLASLIFAALLTSTGYAASPATTGDPFTELKGDWKGSGTVILDDGEKKKVDCTTTYKVAGTNITQTLHCKGEDYEVNTLLKVTDKSGKIKGTWNESVYDASGSVRGTAKGDTIHAIISGDKFSGRMSIKVKGDTHTINVIKLNNKTGTYRLATSLSLHR